MCAMIPMFRVRCSEAGAVAVDRPAVCVVIGLPLEVAEGLVGFGHAVGVLASLDGCADAVAGIHQFAGELVGHALAVSLASRLDEPAHAEADTPIGANLDRDLVRGATDALWLDLDQRHRVAEGLLQDLDAGAAGLA